VANPGRRGVARADDRDQWHRQYGGIAADRDERRRVIDHLQSARIVRFTKCNERNAKFAAGLALALGGFAGANLRRAGATAATERRQGLERRASSAKMIEQRAKRPRPDILAAD
jgi:hypothetical protein